MLDTGFRIEVLGPPTLRRSDGGDVRLPVGKPLALLVYLSLRDGPVSREQLGNLFWPRAPRRNQRASVRQSLWILRTALGRDPFRGDDPLEVIPELVTVDLLEAERLARGGRAIEATELWSHPPFHDFLLPDAPGWEHWTEERRRQAELRVAGALESEGERCEEVGDLEAAARAFEAATRIQPQRALHVLSLIRVLVAARRLDDAERSVTDARSRFLHDKSIQAELDRFENELRVLRRGAYVGQTENLPRVAFVGRVQEFATVVRLWDQLGAQGGGRAIVLGEAGVGKTRLAEEISLLVENRGGRIARVKGREGESGLRWGAVSDLARCLSSLTGAAGVSASTDEILHLVVPNLGGAGGSRFSGRMSRGGNPPRLAEAAGVLPDTAVVDAMADLISAVCEDGPLLLVVDDLQWLDRGSRSALVSLARQTEGEPVLWLFTARTGLPDPSLERSVRAVSDGPRAARLRLAPWTREEVGELLGGIATFPDSRSLERATAVIHGTGAGNPLFTVEILKLLVRRGVLVKEGESGGKGGPEPDEEGSWRFVAERLPDPLPVPSHVEELLAQQILHLSGPAQRILETLVTTGSLRPEHLQSQAGLSTPSMTAGLGELLGQRLVHWVAGDRVDFSHDEVRAVAKARLFAAEPPASSVVGRLRQRPVAVGGVFGGSILFVLLLALSVLPGEAPPPAYGGGSIVVVLPDSAVELVPDHRPPDEWEVRSLEEFPATDEHLAAPFMGPEGTLLWFTRRTTLEDAPWLVELGAGGQERVVVRSDGDDSFLDLSPEGERFLYSTEDPEAPTYTRDLWVGDRVGNEPRRILQVERTVGGGRWSPDGSRIAAVALGDPDTLVLLTPAGDVLERKPYPGLSRLEGWCGSDRLLLQVQRGLQMGLEAWEFATSTARSLHTQGQPLGAVCSPDGTAVFYQTVSRGEVSYILHDFGAEVEYPLPISHESPLSRIAWLPPAPMPTPEVLEVAAPASELRWGESLVLDAEIVRSDGSRTPADGVHWEAGDPSTVSVTAEGRVYANGLGSSWIAGTWENWLSDTLWVDVTGIRGEGTLVAEEFLTLDTNRWALVGSPLPRPTLLEGEPVLEMRGDGRHWDGILLREALPGMRGMTVELELRLLLTGRDRQWFRLCLFDGNLPGALVEPAREDRSPEGGEGSARTEATDVYALRAEARQHPCLVYPNHLGSRSVVDRTSVRIQHLLYPNIFFPLSEPIPQNNSNWVHIALQLRADGELRVFVDRQAVGTSPILLRNDPDTRWRVGIFGAAVETEAYIRNLAVWEGVRYGGVELGSESLTSLP